MPRPEVLRPLLVLVLSGVVLTAGSHGWGCSAGPPAAQDGGESALDATGTGVPLPDAAAPSVELDPCAALVRSWCGKEDLDAAGLCEDTPPCALAKLVQENQAWTCEQRLDGGADQACSERTGCGDLEVKCCGSTAAESAPCADSASCALAREVAAQGRPTSCRQALRDDATFPRCGGP